MQYFLTIFYLQLHLVLQNSLLLLPVGYKVIFLHRVGSAFPFTTGLRSSVSSHIDSSFLTGLEDKKQGIYLNVQNGGRTKSELRCYKHCVKNGMLLSFPFESIDEYLSSLQIIAEELSPLGSRVCFFLAAAVSDFYIPKEEVRTLQCILICSWSSRLSSCGDVMCCDVSRVRTSLLCM